MPWVEVWPEEAGGRGLRQLLPGHLLHAAASDHGGPNSPPEVFWQQVAGNVTQTRHRSLQVSGMHH